jgi:rRNA maturation endonuclease Nob1
MWKIKINKQADKDTELLRLDPYCPKCAADVGGDPNGQIEVKFCPECGGELLQPFRCHACATPLNASSKFCISCGVTAIR